MWTGGKSACNAGGSSGNGNGRGQDIMAATQIYEKLHIYVPDPRDNSKRLFQEIQSLQTCSLLRGRAIEAICWQLCSWSFFFFSLRCSEFDEQVVDCTCFLFLSAKITLYLNYRNITLLISLLR